MCPSKHTWDKKIPPMWTLLVDLLKAFDTANHELLFELLAVPKLNDTVKQHIYKEDGKVTCIRKRNKTGKLAYKHFRKNRMGPMRKELLQTTWWDSQRTQTCGTTFEYFMQMYVDDKKKFSSWQRIPSTKSLNLLGCKCTLGETAGNPRRKSCFSDQLEEHIPVHDGYMSQIPDASSILDHG